MTDRDHIKACLTAIFTSSGFDGTDHLAQRDYEHISAEIASRTGTLISVSTLRRLMHGEFARLPQTATLNAIAGFLGHKNWHEYKSSAMAGHPPAGPGAAVTAPPLTGQSKKERLRTVGVPFLVAAGLAMALLISYSMVGPANLNYGTAEFSVRKTTGDEIPNTVIFTYNVDDVRADSFFIQQSWDRNRRVRVFKNSYTLTDIYYEPGYHTAKLIANDSVIRAIGVSIPTGRWFFYAKRNFYDSIPQYIRTGGMPGDGTLSLTPDDVRRSGVVLDAERYFFYSYVPEETYADADNFHFRARVMLKQVREDLCPFIIPEVFCQQGAMYFKATPKGCVSESILQFGDHFMRGRTSDLSAIGVDVTEWIDMDMVCKDKTVSILYNGQEVFRRAYDGTAGRITGIGFVSNGICKVDFVSLNGHDGSVLYESEFDDGLLAREPGASGYDANRAD